MADAFARSLTSPLLRAASHSPCRRFPGNPGSNSLQPLPENAVLRRTTFLKVSADKMIRSADAGKKYRTQDQQELIQILAEQGNGSMLRGWRRELDPDGLLEVEFQDFCQAVVRLAWSGDAYLLFGADSDFSSLTLTELAPHQGHLCDRFKRWIKEQFVAPAEMLQAFDTSGCGKLTREAFLAGCRAHGFEAADSDLNDLFDLSDAADVGHIFQEDLIFLELDPKARAHSLFKSRMNHMREWRQAVAWEYMERTRQTSLLKMTTPKHRLAPRPWQADIFEQLPVVACQRRQERSRDAQRRSREAVTSFRQHLREGFGNEVRAMRRVLDPEGCFYFTHTALRRYCRKAQLKVRVSDVWQALDKDADGKAAFEEFAVEPAIVLAQFRNWAHGELGSCAAVWDTPEAVFARKRKRGSSWTSEKKMLFGPFAQALHALGWPKVADQAARSLLLASLDSYGCGLIVRSDLEWLDKWRTPEWLCCDPDPEAWVQLKDLLLRTYRHPLRAWRMLLDRDSSNQLCWTEFRDACRKISFDGNMGGAWRALDTDLSGTISMREYDAPSAELLESFKGWAETVFGSVALCYKELDEDKSGLVTLSEFRRACHKLKWTGDVRLLFECLDGDGKKVDKSGKRSISLQDLEFLDSWSVRLDGPGTPPSSSCAHHRPREQTRSAPCLPRTECLGGGAPGKGAPGGGAPGCRALGGDAPCVEAPGGGALSSGAPGSGASGSPTSSAPHRAGDASTPGRVPGQAHGRAPKAPDAALPAGVPVPPALPPEDGPGDGSPPATGAGAPDEADPHGQACGPMILEPRQAPWLPAALQAESAFVWIHGRKDGPKVQQL